MLRGLSIMSSFTSYLCIYIVQSNISYLLNTQTQLIVCVCSAAIVTFGYLSA